MLNTCSVRKAESLTEVPNPISEHVSPASPSVQKDTSDLPVKARKLPFHVVLDLGTSFTTMTYSETGEPLCYPRGQPMPSVVAYLDLADPARPSYRIGVDASAVERASPACCVKSFKKLLGSPEKITVTDLRGRSVALPPDDVVLHFLRGFFRSFAEETHRWPSGVFVTFPVNFTHDQRQRLRSIVEQAIAAVELQLDLEVDPSLAGSVPVALLMDEANAAALAHVVNLVFGNLDELRALGDRWRLLVCDVGGGTTDIVLIEVESVESADGSSFFQIRCKTIAPTGDYSVGGDVLTTVIVDEIAEILAQNEFRVPTQPGEGGDDLVWRRNFSQLFALAAEVKHRLIDNRQVALDRVVAMVFGPGADGFVLQGTDVAGEVVSKNAGEIIQLLRGAVLDRHAIEVKFAPRIELTSNMIGELLAYAGTDRAEVVLLAGRGASWPQYPDIARRHGHTVVTSEPARAKELVARGGWFVEYINNGAFELADIEPAALGTVCPAKIGLALFANEWRLDAAHGPDGKPAIVPGVPVGPSGISGLVRKVRYPTVPVTVGRQYPGAKVEPIEQHVFVNAGASAVEVNTALARAERDVVERLRALEARAAKSVAPLLPHVPTQTLDVLLDDRPSIQPAAFDPARALLAIADASTRLSEGAAALVRAAAAEEELELRRPAVPAAGRVRGRLWDVFSPPALDADEVPVSPVKARADAVRFATLAKELRVGADDVRARISEIESLRRTMAGLPQRSDRGQLELRLNDDLTIEVSFIGDDGKVIRGNRVGTPAQFFTDATVWRSGTQVLANLGLARPRRTP